MFSSAQLGAKTVSYFFHNLAVIKSDPPPRYTRFG